MDGKILATGTLDEVRGWVTNQEVDIDRRFRKCRDRPRLHRSAHASADHRSAVAGRLCRTVRPDVAGGNAEQGARDQAGRPRTPEGSHRAAAGRRAMGARMGISAGVLRQLTADPCRPRSDLERASDLHRKSVDAHLLREQQGLRDRRDRRQHHHSRHHQEGRQADRRDRRDRGGARLRRQAAATRCDPPDQGHLGCGEARAACRRDDIRRSLLRQLSRRLQGLSDRRGRSELSDPDRHEPDHRDLPEGRDRAEGRARLSRRAAQGRQRPAELRRRQVRRRRLDPGLHRAPAVALLLQVVQERRRQHLAGGPQQGRPRSAQARAPGGDPHQCRSGDRDGPRSQSRPPSGSIRSSPTATGSSTTRW